MCSLVTIPISQCKQENTIHLEFQKERHDLAKIYIYIFFLFWILKSGAITKKALGDRLHAHFSRALPHGEEFSVHSWVLLPSFSLNHSMSVQCYYMYKSELTTKGIKEHPAVPTNMSHTSTLRFLRQGLGILQRS